MLAMSRWSLAGELVPGFDLPIIISNADHKAEMNDALKELRERAEGGEE